MSDSDYDEDIKVIEVKKPKRTCPSHNCPNGCGKEPKYRFGNISYCSKHAPLGAFYGCYVCEVKGCNGLPMYAKLPSRMGKRCMYHMIEDDDRFQYGICSVCKKRKLHFFSTLDICYLCSRK